MSFPQHEQKVFELFRRACEILKLKDFTLKPMQRRGVIKSIKGLRLASTNLRSRQIIVDFYTPKKRLPKSYNSILRIIAHEFTHHQKPPYRTIYKGHLINRMHYPAFYRETNKIIKKFKKDEILGQYFKT